MPQWLIWTGAAVAVLIVLGMIGRLGSAPGVGEDAILSDGEGGVVMLGMTQRDYARIKKLISAGDSFGVMEHPGGLATSSGTRCRVIDRSGSLVEVRILDGPGVGNSGFIAAEFVRHAQK